MKCRCMPQPYIWDPLAIEVDGSFGWLSVDRRRRVSTHDGMEGAVRKVLSPT